MMTIQFANVDHTHIVVTDGDIVRTIPVGHEQHVALVEAGAVIDPYAPPVVDLAMRARAERNARMAACDWTMLPDAPVTIAQRDAWMAYRAALRDISLQDGFPTDIQWPIIPVPAGGSA